MQSITQYPQVESSNALKERVMARINERLSPPPTDWVEPKSEPPEAGTFVFIDLTPGDIANSRLDPGVVGKPPS